MSSEEDETLAGMMGVKVRAARWHDVTGKHNAEETLDDDWTYTGAVVAITNGRIFADAVWQLSVKSTATSAADTFSSGRRDMLVAPWRGQSQVYPCVFPGRKWCREAGADRPAGSREDGEAQGGLRRISTHGRR